MSFSSSSSRQEREVVVVVAEDAACYYWSLPKAAGAQWVAGLEHIPDAPPPAPAAQRSAAQRAPEAEQPIGERLAKAGSGFFSSAKKTFSSFFA